MVKSLGAACAIALAITITVGAELPQGFRLEPFVSGLTQPWDLADTADGRILVVERTTGNVRVVRGGILEPNPICTVAVDSTSERGLLGIAVHPDFATNGWIYLYYTALGGNNKVTRYTLTDSSCTSPVHVNNLTNLGVGATGKRNGGGIDFGPDGKLYVATGDMEVPGNGQSLAVIQAKVLRVNDDGSIPSDNPTAGSAIYARGVRDPGSLSVNVAGTVYLSDRGTTGLPVINEEVNVAPAGGNLGWSSKTGSDGAGGFDDPLKFWGTPGGAHGVVDYDGTLFPDADTDGLDNDHDSYGPDLWAGVARTNDNSVGECIGSTRNGLSCTNALDCLPARDNASFTEIEQCEMRDELAEHCAAGDDDCDTIGTAGINEPDESFFLDLFAARTNSIERAVLMGGDSEVLSTWQPFFDSTAFPGECPTSFTGLMSGRDGHLYALALSGGVGGGALYRIVYDHTARPREVSGPTSYVPLRVGKSGADVEIYWEDLRDDAKQVGDNGSVPTAPVRSYTLWRGNFGGNWATHATPSGLAVGGVVGTAVNDVVRKGTIATVAGQNHYFLVSGLGNNLEGPLGKNGFGMERPGYAVTDLCATIGTYAPPSPGNVFKCTPEITLTNEHGELKKLTEYRGSPVWIDFPAEWCAPCIDEANDMEAIYQDFKDRGVRVISILTDEEYQTYSWAGRPTVTECRNWADRPGTNPDHTFECWADPKTCTGNPCQAGTVSQEGFPKYNAFSAFPTNAIIDQGGRVVWTDAGWSFEGTIRNRLNTLVGSVDSCLH